MTGPVDLLDVEPAADEENELLILDREEVLRRVEGNLELLRALVGTFETTHLEYLSRIRAAIDTGDADTLETSAHGLKGAVATLGGARARDAAFQLELTGRGGEVDKDAAQVVGVLEGELGLLRTALRELVAEGAD
jgi:HPt (histidine-containing phosphotransfer) domain-containing protein